MNAPRAPWPPVRYTLPLSEDFPSLWDFWGEVIQALWMDVFGFQLEEWQCQLLRHITEIYPKGHAKAGELRYRSTLTSIASQQGKTEMETALVFLFILEFPQAKIRSMAATREQANELYSRAHDLISLHPEFSEHFNRPTETRGLSSKDGAYYQVVAAKESAIQSFALQLGIADEVHLLPSDAWDALTSRLGSRKNSMISGITTAGDENSTLLIEKYRAGEEAILLPPSKNRFGFFVWEAPEARVPDDDEELWEFLLHSAPALAAGRIDKDSAIADIRAMHPNSVIRYKLNRFTNSLSSLVPLSTWLNLVGPPGWKFPHGRFVLGVARDEYNYATIARARKEADGKIHTDIVATFNDFETSEVLKELLALYYKYRPLAISMPAGDYWKELRDGLTAKNVPVVTANIYAVSSVFYAKIMQKLLVHKDDEFMRRQIPMTIRRTRGSDWRIDRNATNTPIDSVEATAFAIYGAENVPDKPLQVAFF